MVCSYANVKTRYPNLEFHVITDQKERFENLNFHSAGLQIKSHVVENLKWPMATLLRYKLMRQFGKDLECEILMHLDADMLFHENFNFAHLIESASNNLVFIEHPGFWRPKSVLQLSFYMQNPMQFLKDLRRKVAFGGLGNWERNPLSTAHTNRKARKKYVCGGIWLGPREKILGMCETLQNNIEKDLENSYIAVWHDESHLNYWSSYNNCILLDPSYCYVDSYNQLKTLTCLIEAVDKGKNFIRQK